MDNLYRQSIVNQKRINYSKFVKCLTTIKISLCYIIEYKKNFLRLEQLVLIGGPDDGVITPWQSRLVILTEWAIRNIG